MRMRLCSVTLMLFALTAPAAAWEARIVFATGQPVVGATVVILGRTGEAVTDADGRFQWQPDPPPPFEMLVVLHDGTYMKPVTIERLAGGAVDVTVHPLVSEAVTVTGSAPSIESSPAAGTTTVTGRDVVVRQPTNLMQAVENVAGVNQVSEGQAAVPAVRGLARGRTLILIDGARVTAERRVGPSATYMDPSVIEAVDVARGPGSVAYGSDAFGGVISVQTRRVAPATPWAFGFSGTAGAGIPEGRLYGEVAKGLPEGSVLVAAHTREADDWDSPDGEVFNSGYQDSGVLARVENSVGDGTLSVGFQGDYGRDIDRPRNNSQTVRFYYPYEDSNRFTATYERPNLGGLKRFSVTSFLGTYDQRTDQDRFATATTGRTIERADISARDYGVRAFGEKLFGRARVEMGVDLNGRFGLEALDDLITYDLSGEVVSTRPNVSIDNAYRNDTGVYASLDTSLTSVLSLGAGLRGDYVITQNEGGYFGDRSTSNGAASGYLALTAGSFAGFSTTIQVARGFRDPTLSDRYYRGPTGRGFITGNPDLDPETSLQFDWSVRYTQPRYRLGRVLLQLPDRRPDRALPGDHGFLLLPQPRPRARARVRVEGQAELGRGFTLDLAAQVAEGKSLDDDAYLDDIAPVTFITVLRKAFGARAYAMGRLAFYSDDDHFGPTERAVPGYTLFEREVASRSSSRWRSASRRGTCSTRSTTPARTSARSSQPAARRTSLWP